MLPGLVLTVGLLSQSLATLVSAAPRNPSTPRFVNIGDDIVQSDTARPVPPPAACLPPPAPAPPEPAAPEAQRVIVDVQAPNEASDMPAAAPDDVPLDESVPYSQYPGGVLYVPVVVHHASHRAAQANPYAPYYPPIRTVGAPPAVRGSSPQTVGRSSPQAAGRSASHTVMLPSMPTVVLPPPARSSRVAQPPLAASSRAAQAPPPAPSSHAAPPPAPAPSSHSR